MVVDWVMPLLLVMLRLDEYLDPWNPQYPPETYGYPRGSKN